MFAKLAGRNVIRSLRDYSIYFLTLMSGVCVFYVFNSLDAQWVMQSLRGGEGPNRAVLDSILMLVDIFSVFVSVILAFLILYANHFMVRRRKKELGTYLLLGLGHSRVAAVLFLETALIGLLSLAAGLVLGVFLSQLLSVFTAGLFQVTVEQFHFIFSARAVGKTVLYFGIIFLIVMLFNGLSIFRGQLADLLRDGRRNEELKVRGMGASVAAFLAGCALLGAAYTMLLRRGILQVDGLFFVMLALGSLGTLFFFRGLSGFLLRAVQSSKRLYYRGINMFTLRQFSAQVGTNYLSMTVICLMLLLAIGITACSAGLNNTLDARVDAQAPCDFRFFIQARDEEGEPRQVDIPAALKAAGFDPETELALGGTVEQWECQVGAPGSEAEDRPFVRAMPLSSYNLLRRLRGDGPVTLAQGCYGQVLAAEGELGEHLAGLPALELGGAALAADPGAVFREELAADYGGEGCDWLIVPDGLFRVGDPQEEDRGAYLLAAVYCGNYRTDRPAEETETLLWSCQRACVRAALGDGGGWSSLETRLDVYRAVMGSKIMVVFLGLYLGIVFLLCSAAVLALQQLSQAADNAPRYRLLEQLGVEENMRRRSVDVQVLLAFLLPLGLAAVHAAVGMTSANEAIARVGRLDAAASSAVTAAFILAFYGGYLLVTCLGSRRIARGK